MSKKLNELRTDRNKLVAQARGLLDKADAEKRGLSAEEQGTYDKLMADQGALRTRIATEELAVEAERELAQDELRSKKPTGDNPDPENRGTGQRATEEFRTAYTQFLRGGMQSLNADHLRALSAGANAEGGYLLVPEQMSTELIKAVDDIVLIRQWATTIPVPTAATLGVPSLETDPGDADWTSELQTGSEDNSMAFGKRELTPNPLAKRIKVSNELLRRMPGVEGMVTSRLAYKFGITEEKQYLLGDGNKKPLGLFVASSQGISTGRDVSTGNATTSIGFDGLLSAKYALKAQYRRTANWLFHRDAVAQVSKLKDSDGQYLWQPSKAAREPDMLCGLPMNESEYVPNTFTTGQYVGLLGDFKFYWIADAYDMRIKRLDELYAETNQTGFIGRRQVDAMPVLEEAFARVKLA